ncbi:WRKY domain [Dillenia turbinata]|uniref:WRKY domain n=1 Tax=Dillenia turbinata TaxID=194707 RepID=A0AAN8VCW2_9MAGN
MEKTQASQPPAVKDEANSQADSSSPLQIVINDGNFGLGLGFGSYEAMSVNSFDRIFDSLDASLGFQSHALTPPQSSFPNAFLSSQVKLEVSNKEVPASMTVEVPQFPVKKDVETEHMHASINLCPVRESELCLPGTPPVTEKQSSAPEESSHLTKSMHASIILSPVRQSEFCLPTPPLTENQSSAPEENLHETDRVYASINLFPDKQSELCLASSLLVTEKQSSASEENSHETHVHASANLSPGRQSEFSLACSPPVTKKQSSEPEDNSRTPEVCQWKPSKNKVKYPKIHCITPTDDGYRWRKYGQKQIQGTETSRSYYRCTNFDCNARKRVQHCDHSGAVTGISYEGNHNHDPPQKIGCTGSRRVLPSPGPVAEFGTKDCPLQGSHDSEAFTVYVHPEKVSKQLREVGGTDSYPSENNAGCKFEERNADTSDHYLCRDEARQPVSHPLKRKEPESSSLNDVALTQSEEDAVEPRVKEKGTTSSFSKVDKEHKVVISAAADEGMPSDGYRWRKYGQKMVKGSPYPRSYYKCTSVGCPVRKHVEMDPDNASALRITYERTHDHDTLVPSSRSTAPPCAFLPTPAAGVENTYVPKRRTEKLPCRKSSGQWPADIDGDFARETALELGGEKALESAQTLLSMGLELRHRTDTI